MTRLQRNVAAFTVSLILAWLLAAIMDAMQG